MSAACTFVHLFGLFLKQKADKSTLADTAELPMSDSKATYT